MELQDLRWLEANLMSFFTPKNAEVCNRAYVLLKRPHTKGKLVKALTKCIALLFIRKTTLVPVAILMVLSLVMEK